MSEQSANAVEPIQLGPDMAGVGHRMRIWRSSADYNGRPFLVAGMCASALGLGLSFAANTAPSPTDVRVACLFLALIFMVMGWKMSHERQVIASGRLTESLVRSSRGTAYAFQVFLLIEEFNALAQSVNIRARIRGIDTSYALPQNWEEILKRMSETRAFLMQECDLAEFWMNTLQQTRATNDARATALGLGDISACVRIEIILPYAKAVALMHRTERELNR